jgi:hypothetical protein
VETLEALLRSAVERRAAAGWDQAPTAQAALAAIQADGADPDLDDALKTVRHQFGLGEAEIALLEVAATAERSVSGHLLLGLLSGDGRPARPSAALFAPEP